ncbi:MAG TPA: alpha/beta fold hydrolase [Gemmataceae bacterium]|jgi:pimeloyl-ACP methyl ester carboxylesterase|nr:alpha/beta fold hydrolase [Gemmataceae bacterium]
MKTLVATRCLVEYDDRGQGLPVVLLHAFPLSRAMWQPQVQALQKDYRLIVPDLRGFGGTEGFAGTPALEQMADDVYALLEKIRVTEPVVLGGLSMGGYVALAFVRKYPARLRALILADTRAEADSAEGRAGRDSLIAFAEKHTAADVIDQMMPKMVSDETRAQRPEVVREVRRLASAQTTAGIIGALRAMRDRADSVPALGGIVVPTLVVVGSDDVLTPPSLADTLAARIPAAKRVLIQGAGHLSNVEQPELFNEAVRAFLQSLS